MRAKVSNLSNCPTFFLLKIYFYLIDYLKHFTYLKEMVGQVGQMAEVGQIQGNDHNNTELRMPIL